jgi:hypothetical protein
LKLRTVLPSAIVTGALAAATFLAAVPATAEDAPATDQAVAVQTADDMAATVAGLGLPAGAADAPGMNIPAAAGDPATAKTDAGALALTPPATSDGVETDHGVVYDGPGQDSSVMMQTVSKDDGGLRALVSIDSAAAPTSYDFSVGGDVASLEMDQSGGVVARDASGNIVAQAEAPWAVDNNGAKVPTHFEINGTTLTQVVDHTQDDVAYPVTSDPFFWWGWPHYRNSAWGACALNCGYYGPSYFGPSYYGWCGGFWGYCGYYGRW